MKTPFKSSALSDTDLLNIQSKAASQLIDAFFGKGVKAKARLSAHPKFVLSPEEQKRQALERKREQEHMARKYRIENAEDDLNLVLWSIVSKAKRPTYQLTKNRQREAAVYAAKMMSEEYFVWLDEGDIEELHVLFCDFVLADGQEKEFLKNRFMRKLSVLFIRHYRESRYIEDEFEKVNDELYSEKYDPEPYGTVRTL